jgi:hypothetical protein
MHCFPNPAPVELLFPEAGTTWPSGPTGLLPTRTTTQQTCTARSAGGHEISRTQTIDGLLGAAIDRPQESKSCRLQKFLPKSAMCVLCALCVSVAKLLVFKL